MPVETSGSVRLRGDRGPGVAVRVFAEDGRLRLTSGEELIGDWDVHEIRLSSLPEGFAIRVEGEDFVLTADDEPAVAEELGVVAASPRLARKLAASHNPVLTESPPAEASPEGSDLGAITFAVGGALVVLGGTVLRTATAGLQPADDSWIAFGLAGGLMVAHGYVMLIRPRWARWPGLLLVGLIAAGLAYLVTNTVADANRLAAYGFIAGGVVVGLAALVSRSLRGTN